MVWIERGEDRAIKGVYANRQEGYAEEELSGEDPAVSAFLAPRTSAPDSVTKLGLKRALDEFGIWEQVRAAIATDADAQEEWDLAVEIKRTDPLTQKLIAKLQFTDTQVDQIIVRANQLV